MSPPTVKKKKRFLQKLIKSCLFEWGGRKYQSNFFKKNNKERKKEKTLVLLKTSGALSFLAFDPLIQRVKTTGFRWGKQLVFFPIDFNHHQGHLALRAGGGQGYGPLFCNSRGRTAFIHSYIHSCIHLCNRWGGLLQRCNWSRSSRGPTGLPSAQTA